MKLTLLQKIEFDLKKAKENKFQRMVDTLRNLIKIFEINDIRTNAKIFDKLDELIIEKGDVIIKYMENIKDGDLEKEMFEQNVYNQYISDFKYGSHRPIYYEREVDGYINTDLNTEIDAIVFKVK